MIVRGRGEGKEGEVVTGCKFVLRGVEGRWLECVPDPVFVPGRELGITGVGMSDSLFL